MKIVMMAAAAAALMYGGEQQPPRETGLKIPTAQSIPILTACITKRLGQATTEDLPGGGVSVRYGESRTLFIHRPPTLYFDISEDGPNRVIVIRYRHPMSKGTAAKMLRHVGKKCFPYELEAAGGGKLPDADG
jgi:hypothetical protein